ncbi:hypothetical protein [Bartonella sp. ML70XJBT.G]|uniref:hypothetical protein n=1 Tax=Bartonella sp. ML70XJBT.G TaxID=3019093 RepID=UPI0023629654|nr:hypothetical protein [Bartonella sp. ML70XJBT.G]
MCGRMKREYAWSVFVRGEACSLRGVAELYASQELSCIGVGAFGKGLQICDFTVATLLK